MIGLLLWPGREPRVVEVAEWNQLEVSRLLDDPPTIYRRTFESPGSPAGRMNIAYGARGARGARTAGPVNTYATALVADELPTSSPIRGPALVLRSGSLTNHCSLTKQDCMALAARLVASEYRPLGRGGRSPRRGR